MAEHGGGHGGYCNHMLRFPELHLSVVVMFIHFLWNSREYALKVADLFSEDNPDLNNDIGFTTSSRTTTALDSSILKGLGGSYFNPDRPALRTVSFDDGSLNFEGSKLRPINEMRTILMRNQMSRWSSGRIKKGKPANVTTYTSTGEYSYNIVEVEIPSVDVLKRYQGRYYFPELEVYWTIQRAGNHLDVHRRKYPDSWLTPLFRDAFSDDWSSIAGYQITLIQLFYWLVELPAAVVVGAYFYEAG